MAYLYQRKENNMCKCENCGKEGEFFSDNENWYYLPGPVGHTLCDKCLPTALEKINNRIITENTNG